jgi:MFS family permease
MKPGFYTIMAAQFFSSLADNALLIAAIALLRDLNEPSWMTPALKQSFVLSYVVLAPLVGAFADSMPKGRVMLITNAIKIAGCALMLFTIHPLAAYAVVGFGAAAYSPAKYGILTELLPPQLVIATAGSRARRWPDHSLYASGARNRTARLDDAAGVRPSSSTLASTRPEAAIAIVMIRHAAIFNRVHLDTGVDHGSSTESMFLIRASHCVSVLRASWANFTRYDDALQCGATPQFIVIDRYVSLGFNLSQASMLQGVVAVGIAVGAVIAARYVSLRGAVGVLPIGAAMGFIVMAMIFVTNMPVAIVLMIAIGACAGFFVVPMNALLQHRGHVLMGAGHSIAVQNFNENIGILAMVGLYALMLGAGFTVNVAIVLFGLFVAGTMALVMLRHRMNQSRGDLLHLIGTEPHRALDAHQSPPRH